MVTFRGIFPDYGGSYAKTKAASTTALATLTLLLAACAGNSEKESVIAKNDAIDDYIKVAELQEIDQIRVRQQLHHKVITDQYILLYDDREPYLAAFKRRCRELKETKVTPDYRRDAHNLYAQFDTYRGCKIEALYEVSNGQAVELLDLGKKAMQ
jgi:hypothetical protein